MTNFVIGAPETPDMKNKLYLFLTFLLTVEIGHSQPNIDSVRLTSYVYTYGSPLDQTAYKSEEQLEIHSAQSYNFQQWNYQDDSSVIFYNYTYVSKLNPYLVLTSWEHDPYSGTSYIEIYFEVYDPDRSTYTILSMYRNAECYPLPWDQKKEPDSLLSRNFLPNYYQYPGDTCIISDWYSLNIIDLGEEESTSRQFENFDSGISTQFLAELIYQQRYNPVMLKNQFNEIVAFLSESSEPEISTSKLNIDDLLGDLYSYTGYYFYDPADKKILKSYLNGFKRIRHEKNYETWEYFYYPESTFYRFEVYKSERKS